MLENWVYDYDTLKGFAVDASGKTIPRDLVEKMNRARYFSIGMDDGRQLGLTNVSLQYYLGQAPADLGATARANDGNLMAYRFLKKLRDEASIGPATEKLLTGGDLVTLGFSPGPQFSEILRVVDDLQLEKKLGSQDEALEYVVKHFVR